LSSGNERFEVVAVYLLTAVTLKGLEVSVVVRSMSVRWEMMMVRTVGLVVTVALVVTSLAPVEKLMDVPHVTLGILGLLGPARVLWVQAMTPLVPVVVPAHLLAIMVAAQPATVAKLMDVPQVTSGIFGLLAVAQVLWVLVITPLSADSAHVLSRVTCPLSVLVASESPRMQGLI
jgi:hypothetical protein